MRARRCWVRCSPTAATSRPRRWSGDSGCLRSRCWNLPRPMRNPCCKNGRRAAVFRCPAISKWPAKAPTMRPTLPPRCRSKALRLSGGKAPTSKPPSRPQRSPCCCAKGYGRPHKMADPDAQPQKGGIVPPDETPARCGFVALIGAPNSGKSTLTNALVGTKVSIVTHKAQTTRGPVRGIALIGNAQVVLVDTPGIFQPKRRLDRAMAQAAWERAADADIVALVIDAARGLDNKLAPIVEHLPNIKRPTIAVLNKVDLVKKPDLLRLTAELLALKAFDEVFMVSALTGDGVDGLKTYFAQAMPAGPWLFPEDQLSDASLRQTPAEITREK